MPIIVRDLVEVIDETSALYHQLGVVVGFTRSGRPIVEFRRRRRRFARFPLRLLPLWVASPVAMEADQVGAVPALA